MMNFTEAAETLGFAVGFDGSYYVAFEYATEAEAFMSLLREEGIRVYCDFIRDPRTKRYYVYERRY